MGGGGGGGSWRPRTRGVAPPGEATRWFQRPAWRCEGSRPYPTPYAYQYKEREWYPNPYAHRHAQGRGTAPKPWCRARGHVSKPRALVKGTMTVSKPLCTSAQGKERLSQRLCIPVSTVSKPLNPYTHGYMVQVRFPNRCFKTPVHRSTQQKWGLQTTHTDTGQRDGLQTLLPTSNVVVLL